MTNEKQVSRSVHYKTYKECMSAYNWIKIHFRPQSEVFKSTQWWFKAGFKQTHK